MPCSGSVSCPLPGRSARVQSGLPHPAAPPKAIPTPGFHRMRRRALGTAWEALQGEELADGGSRLSGGEGSCSPADIGAHPMLNSSASHTPKKKLTGKLCASCLFMAGKLRHSGSHPAAEPQNQLLGAQSPCQVPTPEPGSVGGRESCPRVSVPEEGPCCVAASW